MKYRLIQTLLFLCPLVLYGAPGKVTRESLAVEGQSRTYFLFVPKELPASGTVPLLVLLHGSGHDGSSLVEKWKGFASKEAIILAGPSSQNPAGWTAPADGPGFLRQVVEAVAKDYPVNLRRVYLFGHSAGAAFALVMACWESQFFAAASVHAGAFRGPTEFEVMASAKRKIPVQLIIGTRDPFFPVSQVRATRDAFQKNGFPVEIEEIPSHDHNYYNLSSGINRDAWRFLKDKELSADPK